MSNQNFSKKFSPLKIITSKNDIEFSDSVAVNLVLENVIKYLGKSLEPKQVRTLFAFQEEVILLCALTKPLCHLHGSSQSQ